MIWSYRLWFFNRWTSPFTINIDFLLYNNITHKSLPTPFQKRSKERLPEPSPGHAKKQSKKRPPSPVPPKRTTRPRRGLVDGDTATHKREFDRRTTLSDHKGKTSSTLGNLKATSHIGLDDRGAKATTAKAGKISGAKTVEDKPVKNARLGSKATTKNPVGRPKKLSSAQAGKDDGPVKDASAEILDGKRRRRPPPRWEVDKPTATEVAAARVVTRSRSTRRNPASS